jgi:hypothetical protein
MAFRCLRSDFIQLRNGIAFCIESLTHDTDLTCHRELKFAPAPPTIINW